MSLVDPALAGPHTPQPRLLYEGDLEVDVYGYRQRYPIEVWEVCNGLKFPIVTSVPVNTSLTNAAERIAAAIAKRWPGGHRIIEFWPEGYFNESTFVYGTGDGQHEAVDRAELARMGLVLPVIPPS
jgi:hypothetical protein